MIEDWDPALFVFLYFIVMYVIVRFVQSIGERRRESAWLEQKRHERDGGSNTDQQQIEHRPASGNGSKSDDPAEREKARQDYEDAINRTVPPDVRRSMQAFEAGQFFGEDRSPLAYVGYRVGKTHGLAEWDRRRRLDVCFRMAMPQILGPKYRSWGKPASETRLRAMINHLNMLADMRRDRRNYEIAVAEWQRDSGWVLAEYAGEAALYRRLGIVR